MGPESEYGITQQEMNHANLHLWYFFSFGRERFSMSEFIQQTQTGKFSVQEDLKYILRKHLKFR